MDEEEEAQIENDATEVGGVEGFPSNDGQEKEEVNALTGVLSTSASLEIKAESESESELLSIPPTLSPKKAPKGRRDRKAKGNEFQRLLSPPNVQFGLHLADLAREYSTIMDVNVETKHLWFVVSRWKWC